MASQISAFRPFSGPEYAAPLKESLRSQAKPIMVEMARRVSLY